MSNLVEAYNNLNDATYYTANSQGDIYKKASGVIGVSEFISEESLADALEERIRKLIKAIQDSNDALHKYRRLQADVALRKSEDLILIGSGR